MVSIDSKVNNLGIINEASIPSIAFFETPIAISSVGSNNGKLRTAINVVLLLAFETIPDTKVNTEEKPIEVNIIVRKKNKLFCTGLPKITLYARKPILAIISESSILNNSLLVKIT
jgi:hypothetical protein